MTNQLSVKNYFTPEGLDLPEVLSGAEFFEVGRHIKMAKKLSVQWLKQWRNYGENQFGEEFVQDTEAQIELDLGLASLEMTEKPPLNPKDKSTAIVTIQGIRQSFDLWHRKMAPQIPNWSRDQRKMAAELLRPMVEFNDYLLATELGNNYEKQGL